MAEVRSRHLKAGITTTDSSKEVLGNENDTELLATMGYKQELKRNFTLIEVFGLAFSIMGLLPSIASTLSFSVPAGSVGMVWGWFLAGGLIFVIGLAMADLASAMPTSGGLYWWTNYFASENARRPLSFLVGYSNTLGLIGGLTGVDYGFALMFCSVIVIARDGNWIPSNGIVYSVFLCTVIFHGVLSMSFQRIIGMLLGKLQTVFIFANLTVILATIIALPIGTHERNDGAFIFGNEQNLTTWPQGWAFMLAWLSPIWTIGGFDSCVHMSEEASNAAVAVPYGILMATGTCWILGWIILIVIAACMNQDATEILGTPFGQPMAQIYFDALGKKGALGMMSLLMIIQFCMGLSFIIAASRQSWAFSRDGALPFSRFFRPVSKRFGYMPLRTNWGCVLVAAVLGLLTLIAPAAASAVFSLGVAGEYLAWGLPIFSRLVWGESKFVPGPFYTGKWLSRPIGWLAVTFILFSLILSMFPVEGPNPTKDQMNYTVVINGAVWGGAILYYYIDARKWFKGPKVTLDADKLSAEQQQALMDKGLDFEGLLANNESVDGTRVQEVKIPEPEEPILIATPEEAHVPSG